MTRLLCLAASAVFAVPLHGQTPEVEPNDGPATATKVELGAISAGVLIKPDSNSIHNSDWWSFDAVAGDTLQFEWDDAVVLGGNFYGITQVRLYAQDGTTFLLQPRSDPQLDYVIKTTGRYYLELSADERGGDDYYELGLWTNRHPKPRCEVANDREPNDADAAARDVAIGERVDGILCPSRDRDAYRFHATSRMRLQIRIDRDTGSKPSAWGNPILEVWSDHTYERWKSDWRNGSVLDFWVPETGDYTASVATSGGGTNIKYSLTIRAAGSVPEGPGEPVATLAANLRYPLAFAVAPNGDLYVSELGHDSVSSSIFRISPTAPTSQLVITVHNIAWSLAFDTSGNLLEASDQTLNRVSPSGQITPLINTAACPWCPGSIAAIAVARDGTIWSTSPWGQINHFDSDGHFLDSTNVNNAIPRNPSGLGYLAIAPDGTPYFASGAAIYRLVSGIPELFVMDTTEADQVAGANAVGGFAFDTAGNLYVTHPFSGGISLYDRTGAEIGKPYAWLPIAPHAIAFGRNADGSTNRRLFVLAANFNRQLAAFENGTIFELHSSDVDPPPPPPPPQITVAAAIAELLHPGRLSTEQLATLDQGGNSNGRYDIGDLRAFLIANGVSTAGRALRQ